MPFAKLNGTIGRTNESAGAVREGLAKLAELTEPTMTFTSADLRAQVTRATEASDGEYDVAAIVAEIVERHGAVDIETLEADEFWEIVGKHVTD